MGKMGTWQERGGSAKMDHNIVQRMMFCHLPCNFIRCHLKPELTCSFLPHSKQILGEIFLAELFSKASFFKWRMCKQFDVDFQSGCHVVPVWVTKQRDIMCHLFRI